jgi:hypothetical protein
MKKIILIIPLIIYLSNVFSQKQIIPQGDWEFVEYAQSEDLSFEDFSDCFWCQLGAEKFFTLTEKYLEAELNGEQISYKYEIKNNQLILSNEQTIQVTTESEGTKTQTTTGQTIFDFIRKGKKLFLTESNAQGSKPYTFLLRK